MKKWILTIFVILSWIAVCWMSYEMHAIRKSVNENNLLIGVNQYCVEVLQEAKIAELNARKKVIFDESFEFVDSGTMQAVLTLPNTDTLIDIPRINPEVKSLVLQFIRDQVHAMYEQGYDLDPSAASEGRIEFIIKEKPND